MKKAKKEREQPLKSEDYTQLNNNVDVTLNIFQDLKGTVKSEWFLWSMSFYTREVTTKTIEQVQLIWRENKELATKSANFTSRKIYMKSIDLGGASTFENENEYTVYFVMSEDGTESDYLKIHHVATSTVKVLRTFYPPKCGFGLSHYLDNFLRLSNCCSNGSLIIDISRSAWCWYEFLFDIAGTENTHLLNQSFELPTVSNLPSNYFELMRNPPVNKEEPWLHPEQDFRLHPEVRLIEQDIYEASIIALKFLKTKVEARIQKLAATKQKGKTGGKKKTNGERGRPKVTEEEAQKRRKLKADWVRAHKAKVSKVDFCEDKGIEVEYLNNSVLRWCCDHPE